MSTPAVVALVLIAVVAVVGGQAILSQLSIRGVNLLRTRAEREFERAYLIRGPLPDEEMVRRYFPQSDMPPEIPVRIRRIFARHLKLLPEKIFPDDDFGAIYSDLDLTELFREIEEAFGVRFTGEESSRTRATIRAVSTLTAKKRQGRPPS